MPKLDKSNNVFPAFESPDPEFGVSLRTGLGLPGSNNGTSDVRRTIVHTSDVRRPIV